MDSDVPVPYGRTVLLPHKKPYTVNIDKRNDVLVAVMASNCGGRNNRWKYVTELKKYIDVHFYGRCGTIKCGGHFDSDCDELRQYKFYLSFENSNCPEYITEKLWWNAYAKNSIPIVMGGSRRNYKQLLPPKSYINVADFTGPKELARFLLNVNKSQELYDSFFDWQQYFEVRNEHGYFKTQSYHYCRICEALNFNNNEPKVYQDLEKFWSKQKCFPSWDAKVLNGDDQPASEY